MADFSDLGGRSLNSAAVVPRGDSQPIVRTIRKKPSLLSQISTAAGNVAQTGMEALAAPVELVGEAIRVPIEQGEGFRAPSIVQRFAPSTRTEERPSIGFDVANKLLRAGAAFGARLPQGVDAAQNAALEAYQGDRGILGTVEDTALSLLAGKLPVSVPGTSGAKVNLATAPLEVAGEAAKFIGKGAKVGGDIAKATGQGAIRTLLGPTAEQQKTFFGRRSEVEGAKAFDELADEFAGSMNKLAEKVNDLDNEAWDSLLKLKAEPQSKILRILKSVRKDFQGTGGSKIGDADRAAVAKIDEYIDRVQKISGGKYNPKDPGTEKFLDQRQLREIVQSVRRDATFGGITETPTNLAAQKTQGKLDAMLKENGNYEQIMREKVAPATKALMETAKKFNFKREPGVGFVPTDQTAQKISGFDRGFIKKPETRKVIERFVEQSGDDLVDKSKLAAAKETFLPTSEQLRDNARGTTRTALGALAGLALEPIIPGSGFGPLLVGGLGRSADMFGGVAAGKIIDAARALSEAKSRVPSVSSVPGASPTINFLKQLFAKENIAPLTAASRQIE